MQEGGSFPPYMGAEKGGKGEPMSWANNGSGGNTSVVNPPQVRQVNMIRAGAMGGEPARAAMPPPIYPYANPLFMGPPTSVKPPKFSGLDAEWHRFVREWQDYQRLLAQMWGAGVSDQQWLEFLKDCLDEASQFRLQARREANPRLTFGEF